MRDVIYELPPTGKKDKKETKDTEIKVKQTKNSSANQVVTAKGQLGQTAKGKLEQNVKKGKKEQTVKKRQKVIKGPNVTKGKNEKNVTIGKNEKKNTTMRGKKDEKPKEVKLKGIADKKGKTKIYELNGKKVNKERFDFVPKPKKNHPKSIGENKVFGQLNVSSNVTFLVLDKTTLMKTAKTKSGQNNVTQSSKKSKNRQGKIAKKVSRYSKFIICHCKFRPNLAGPLTHLICSPCQTPADISNQIENDNLSTQKRTFH